MLDLFCFFLLSFPATQRASLASAASDFRAEDIYNRAPECALSFAISVVRGRRTRFSFEARMDTLPCTESKEERGRSGVVSPCEHVLHDLHQHGRDGFVRRADRGAIHLCPPQDMD